MTQVEHDGWTVDSSAETPEAVHDALSIAPDSPAVGDAAQGAGEGGEAADDPPPSSAAHAPDADQPDETAEQQAQRERDEAGRFAKKRKDPQARIDAITYEREEAKRQAQAEKARADQLAAELETLRRGHSPQPGSGAVPGTEPAGQSPAATSPEKPQLAAFESYEDYVEALADWKTDQKLAALKAEQAAADAQRASQARAVQYTERAKAFAAAVPDFEARITSSTAPVSLAMHEAMLTSERGPELAYFLATHPQEAHRLAQESKDLPASAAPLMRQLLEAKLAPSAASVPGAATGAPRTPVPRPITPVGSSAVQAEPDPTELEFGPEYVRRMNALEAKKRGA